MVVRKRRYVKVKGHYKRIGFTPVYVRPHLRRRPRSRRRYYRRIRR